jgi:hypothetical protein
MKINNLKAILLAFVILNSISLDIARKIKSNKDFPKALKNKRFSRVQESKCTQSTKVSGSGWSCAKWIEFLIAFAKEFNKDNVDIKLVDSKGKPECSADNIANTINNNTENTSDSSSSAEASGFSNLFNLANWKTYIGRAMATIRVITECVETPWWKIVLNLVLTGMKAVAAGALFTLTAGVGLAVTIVIKVATFIKKLLFIANKCLKAANGELSEAPKNRGTCFGYISRAIINLLSIRKRKHKSKYRLFRKFNDLK